MNKPDGGDLQHTAALFWTPSALAWRDVLVEAEEVVGVVLALQGLQAVILLGPVGLADALLALVHQEVDVNARVVGLECRPEVPDPLPLRVEAFRCRSGGRDV